MKLVSPLLLVSCFVVACGGGDEGSEVDRSQVIEDYSALVAATYADSLATARDLSSAIDDLTDEPNEKNLRAARDAWLVARDPYGESEAFRFYDGPIDGEDGPEGLLNAWPIDESYIDYVLDGNGEVLETGIINMPDEYPDIDQDLLVSLNEAQGETTISTGYHAIEFLLWGQDHDPDGPGDRPYTDYVSGADGTAQNPARRALYLRTAAELLVANLEQVESAWHSQDDGFRAELLALPPRQALGKVLLGMGSLAGAELSGERMTVAYDNKDPEDEHSCFSDNTKADLRNNARSVQNVLLGRYGDLDGIGIDEVVEAEDPALAQRLRDQIQAALDDIEAIPDPFDQAILGDDDDEGRRHVLAAIRSLQDFTETLVEAAAVLDIPLELE